MKKTSLLVLLTCFAGLAFAREQSAEFEAGWAYNSGWPYYQPAATVEIVETPEDGSVLHIFKAEARDGGMLSTRKHFPVVDGEVVRLRFEAKGTGEGQSSLYVFGAPHVWLANAQERKFDVTDQWQPVEQTFVIKGPAGKTIDHICPALGVRKGGDVQFRKIRLVRGLTTERTDYEDGFERTMTSRPGSPKIARDYITPGLLVETCLGDYTAATPTNLLPPNGEELPADEGRTFLRTGFRLYRLGGRLEAAFASGREALALTLRPSDDYEAIEAQVTGSRKFLVSNERLPADFLFSLSGAGEWDLEVRSLSDSSARSIGGLCAGLQAPQKVTRTLRLVPEAAKSATARLDNLFVGLVGPDRQASADYAYRAQPEETFDPVQKGWKCVFADEFDGVALDTNKWMYSYPHAVDYVDVTGGVLRIKADFDPQGDGHKLKTGSIRTREKFLYGYYEARIKFTRQSGWWAAFWLCESGISNPFINGFEIDIFEDYYTRILKPTDGPHGHVNDHNLHTYLAGTLKSWNYNSIMAPDELGDAALDEWHTIAVKWTPFEITYYYDGKVMRPKAKANHSPYDTVTFDAFRHSACTVPLRAIVSGQIMKKHYRCHDPAGFKFPEYYQVDSVRIYAGPDQEPAVLPTVELEGSLDESDVLVADQPVTFTAHVRPNAKGRPIRAVHLFDNGAHLLTCTNAPYRFDLTVNEGFYNKTAWMRAGRQNTVPTFNGASHAFVAFAEDVDGHVGFSPTRIFTCPPQISPGSRPRGGQPHPVPGTICIGDYDEGGEGVAYHDSTGIVGGGKHVIGAIVPEEWVNYTINVEKEGDYDFSISYGTPFDSRHQLDVYLDGRRLTRFEMKAHATNDWRTDTTASARVHLPAGCHHLTLLMQGSYNLGDMIFSR